MHVYMQGGGAPEIVKLKITSSSMVFVPAQLGGTTLYIKIFLQ